MAEILRLALFSSGRRDLLTQQTVETSFQHGNKKQAVTGSKNHHDCALQIKLKRDKLHEMTDCMRVATC